MKKINIRHGEKKDLPRVLELIMELARFEKAEGEVLNTVEQMEQDGFGPNPVFSFLIAEDSTGIHGLSLYNYHYSTWKGKRLYLEDLVVAESKRGTGIGKMLLQETMRQSLKDNCTGMMWQVLDWNQPAIDFYKSFKTRLDDEWVNCHLEKAQIIEMLKS